ncbi:hypothetical protein C8F04DRAFT_1181741 [Mycena alexandri]|uniref:Uncharacterized protein n=1 Tax=Mycena alexandri TaxID=1745969 RepID=A0AAD6X5R7_9AGAR|nr:hypothetical protein C8F04DRAFT_1181741 [Mycena alexandri]
MPPKPTPKIKAVTGPPRELIARIEYLRDLLKYLPDSLPVDPADSPYRFCLDPDCLEMGGYFGASRCPPKINEGRSGERETFRTSWIKRLISTAVASGAKIPSPASKRKAAEPGLNSESALPAAKKAKAAVIIVDTDLESEASPIATSSAIAPPPPPSISSNSRSKPITGKPKQSTLAGMGWKTADVEQIQKYWRKVNEDNVEKRREKVKRDQRTQEEKKERERELARLRKQRQREREKEAADEEPDPRPTVNQVLRGGAEAAAQTSSIGDVADLSRPATQGWKKHRNGTQGGVVQNVATKRAVADLQRSHPHLFNASGNRLHRGTIWKWIVPGERCFTDAALKSISNRRSLVGTGRVGILAPYPDLVANIVTTLEGIRASGCVVNVPIACSVMIALIKNARPELLDKFKCSEKFVRAFLESKLDWTMCKATRTAKHIPDNASELCERALFCLAYAIEHENIPAKLLINYDQTGVYIRPSQGQTFAPRGSKQVDLHGKDEKRALTLGIATTADGTPASTGTGLGRQDTFITSDQEGRWSDKRTSHFSTQKTMRELFTIIFKAHIEAVIAADPDLDEDQKSILYFDIYPVHISKELLLRDASVQSCVELYDWLSTPDGRDVITRSWKQCVVPGKPEYDLSYATLTSKATRKALRAYLKTDTILADEIKARLGSSKLPPLPDDLPTTGVIVENNPDGDIHGDDSDVPLSDVIRVALGEGLVSPAPSDFEVTKSSVSEDGPGLTAANEEDDI